MNPSNDHLLVENATLREQLHAAEGRERNTATLLSETRAQLSDASTHLRAEQDSAEGLRRALADTSAERDAYRIRYNRLHDLMHAEEPTYAIELENERLHTYLDQARQALQNEQTKTFLMLGQLSAISSILPPATVADEDGKVYQFINPAPAETLQHFIRTVRAVQVLTSKMTQVLCDNAADAYRGGHFPL